MMGGTPGCPAAGEQVGDGCEGRARSTVRACLRAGVSIWQAACQSASQSVGLFCQGLHEAR